MSLSQERALDLVLREATLRTAYVDASKTVE